MARITVEDCLDNVDNRFQLVVVASKRARQITKGTQPLVEQNNDKATVLALREIAEGLITASILEDAELALSDDMEIAAEAPQQDLAPVTSAENVIDMTPRPKEGNAESQEAS